MSQLFFAGEFPTPAAKDGAVWVEGAQIPDPLARASGVFISAAGSGMLERGNHPLMPSQSWNCITADHGKLQLTWGSQEHIISFRTGEYCVIPPNTEEAMLITEEDARISYISIAGPLAPEFLQRMGILLHAPIKQVALPSQLYLIGQIVQVMVRHNGTSDASFQLQQLLWGMLASHAGQPVAMDAMLSHEIAKVVDALRANQYKDNFSLAEMAAISRMPVETFRKRFVAEVGMPPLGYLLFCKMERAKTLLKNNYSVKQTGAEVGMQDPYHFSKQFKNIVGMSPSAYIKQAQGAK